jgi:hypothetical protein
LQSLHQHVAISASSSSSPEKCLENRNIPIHEKITLYADQGVCFDGPEAQVVNVSGQISLKDQEEILRFYKESLKSLGWLLTCHSPLTFEREDQVFTIQLQTNNSLAGFADISFSLEPKETSPCG